MSAKDKADKVSGAIKQQAGKATGNRRTEAEGAAQKSKAAAKDKIDEFRDTAEGAAEGLKSEGQDEETAGGSRRQ